MIEDLGDLSPRIHFVGVSGAGMLPLALCLKEAGFEVSGEDDALSVEAEELLEAAEIPLLPAASISANDEAGCSVVRSSAIGDGHPAVRAAGERRWPVLRRGECLALLAKEKKLIAIAGSHGKTTTCGMLIDLLESIGIAPRYALGGLFANGKAPGRWSDSEWLIAEVDESDGTIELFSPEVSVILNADYDHHAHYENAEAYLSAFERLARRTRGKVVLSASLREPIGSRLEPGKAVYPDSSDDCFERSNALGAFNRENARAAARAASEAGFVLPIRSYRAFTPIRRRQSYLYYSPRLKLIEDYAHHPAEIDAFAKAFLSDSTGKTVAVFQPHRYSRTLSLKKELAGSLSVFDYVYLMDVYAASEKPEEGGRGEDLLQSCRDCFDRCDLVDADDRLLERLREECSSEGEVNVVFLGAGRTDALGRRFATYLESKEKRWGRLYSGIAPWASCQSRIREKEPLASKTTMRVGGAAELYLEPASLEELQTALRICDQQGLPVHPLGRGSNLIVPDAGVAGLVIRLTHPMWKGFEHLEAGGIRVGAGLRIKELCGMACREELEGFEFLEGIPGSVGGALRMNAGAMGGWMFDVVKRVRYLTLDGSLVEADATDLKVGYRHCEELKRGIAIDAVLWPKSVGKKEAALRQAIDVYQSKRKESQPREPSAGCIFKNPEADSAGRLIDELGLKGTVIGGAEISGAHGNFIINRGGASSEDVIELVRLARRIAKRERSVELEPEALLYGQRWEDVLG